MSLPILPQHTKKRKSKRPTFPIRNRDGPPPISKLNDDLLWRIFNLNTLTDTDMIKNLSSSEFSLTTARHTSQVCAGWRSLMLASSSLWASTINLKHLEQKNDNWRDEILKRTGNALISIGGRLEKGGHAAQFFLSLLGEHWTRLRRLSIHVEDPVIAEDERWLSVHTPAPNLEIFYVWFSSPPAFSTADDVLFSNDAPSMHTLVTHKINFKLSERWLTGLRRLDLFGCSVEKTILFALAEMLALESLDMMNIDIIDVHTEDRLWPMIILPKLKRISLSVNLTTLTALIGYIYPTLGCTFEYESCNDKISLPTTEDIFLLRRGFSTHFQCFSDFWHNDTISWMMTEDILELTNVLKAGGNSAFYVHIEIERGSPWHVIPNIILHSLYSYDLRRITTLELDISQDALDVCDWYFAKFLRSLSSVATMHTDSSTMQVLVHLQEDLLNGEILFSSLKSIVFDTDAELICSAIMQFLLQRRDAGVPITDFDLYDCTSPNQDRLLFLEGIKGLDVDWNEEIRNGM
ncbi:hypothetical protein GALMADRAFT_254888 [Galerina marginata CBS 339.88]|uniref:F-box domain-containing protein n=1 Tax=Galerina marginata (strain CBS 339.88) TaxID=685588 RepID=A0A067SUQ3_GALM3|nr:hypothetical protein GALMADRAFT_254888 [Galerina marginata CBS 339.88]